MPQDAVPISDVAIGSWLDPGGATSDLYQECDEAIGSNDGDTTYANNPNTDTSSTILEFGLTPLTYGGVAATANNYRLRVIARRFSAIAVTLTVRLRLAGATVATATHTMTSSYAIYDLNLTQSEVDAITAGNGWGALSVQMFKSAASVGLRVTTVGFRIPSEVFVSATMIDQDTSLCQESALAKIGATLLDADLETAQATAMAKLSATVVDQDFISAVSTAKAALAATALDIDLATASERAIANALASLLDSDEALAQAMALAQSAATLIDGDTVTSEAISISTAAAAFVAFLDEDLMTAAPTAVAMLSATAIDLDVMSGQESAIALLAVTIVDLDLLTCLAATPSSVLGCVHDLEGAYLLVTLLLASYKLTSDFEGETC